jgi:hypothetical protein
VVHDEKNPLSAVTGSRRDALRLDCVGVGFSIYPGSANARIMYEELRALAEESKAAGLAAAGGRCGLPWSWTSAPGECPWFRPATAIWYLHNRCTD